MNTFCRSPIHVIRWISESWGMSSRQHMENHNRSWRGSEACLPFYPSYPRCAWLVKDRANMWTLREYGYWHLKELLCKRCSMGYDIANGSRTSLMISALLRHDFPFHLIDDNSTIFNLLTFFQINSQKQTDG